MLVLVNTIMQNAWLLLVIAGLMETGWALGLKYTEGFTKLWPSLGTIALMAGSFYLLSKSLEELPIGTAYAVWTGIGAAGTVIVGILVLGESRDIIRILCLLLIVAGIVGMKVFSPE
jgi:quaternary ammonium compound-resistance protein SugE